jgi:hypothetical protein
MRNKTKTNKQKTFFFGKVCFFAEKTTATIFEKNKKKLFVLKNKFEGSGGIRKKKLNFRPKTTKKQKNYFSCFKCNFCAS